uniref:Transmembrane protein 231 n=1 Tax=Anisakis simplex TaxID=6269 RepID=A0A0M3J5J4_ANISI
LLWPLQMETALFGDIEKLAAGRSLTVSGDLQMDQAVPLASFGWDFAHNGALINESKVQVSEYDPNEIILRNSFRNYTTVLNRKVERWSAKSTEDANTFVFSYQVRIPEQLFTYRTGLFELLKFAWIQYLSIFVVVRFALRNLLKFIFENRILSTIVSSDNKHLD